VRNLKELFAPKLCRIWGALELRILKDLLAHSRGAYRTGTGVPCPYKSKKRQLSAAWRKITQEGL